MSLLLLLSNRNTFDEYFRIVSRYHYSSKVIDAIKKSHLFSEYGRLMPWNDVKTAEIETVMNLLWKEKKDDGKVKLFRGIKQ